MSRRGVVTEGSILRDLKRRRDELCDELDKLEGRIAEFDLPMDQREVKNWERVDGEHNKPTALEVAKAWQEWKPVLPFSYMLSFYKAAKEK